MLDGYTHFLVVGALHGLGTGIGTAFVKQALVRWRATTRDETTPPGVALGEDLVGRLSRDDLEALRSEARALSDASGGAEDDGFQALLSAFSKKLTEKLLVLTPGQRVGRYEITDLLGWGGFGITYRARDTALDGKEVALKVCQFRVNDVDVSRPEFRIRERLIEEARKLGKLDHPSILKLHEVITLEEPAGLNGSPGIVTDVIRGRSLRCNMTARLPWNEAREVVLSILRALVYVHGQGIWHLDLKPENVLVEDGDAPLHERTIKLIDFGLARADPSGHGKTQVQSLVAGTASYMAPEQFQDGLVGPFTDVYAVGVLLHELAAGGRPQVAELPGGVPAAGRTVIERATASDRRKRFASAAEFLAALDSVQPADVETSATPPLTEARLAVAAESTGVSRADGRPTPACEPGAITAKIAGGALWSHAVSALGLLAKSDDPIVARTVSNGLTLGGENDTTLALPDVATLQRVLSATRKLAEASAEKVGLWQVRDSLEAAYRATPEARSEWLRRVSVRVITPGWSEEVVGSSVAVEATVASNGHVGVADVTLEQDGKRLWTISAPVINGRVAAALQDVEPSSECRVEITVENEHGGRGTGSTIFAVLKGRGRKSR